MTGEREGGRDGLGLWPELPCLSGGVSRDMMERIIVISMMARQPTTGTEIGKQNLIHKQPKTNGLLFFLFFF